MSEIRHDRISGEWTIIAPKRRQRPGAAPPADNGTVETRFSCACPFCPGNESLLPTIIQERKLSSPPGWQVRVVPNKYPALEETIEAKVDRTQLYESFAGAGRHEVIIEHPRHDRDLAAMSHGDVLAVLETYRARHRALMDDARIESVVLFRNHGENSGASIGHPHSQVIGLAMIPPLILDRAERCRRYHEREARCPICDIIARERQEGSRVVAQSDHFVAIVPFAAASPFEVRLIPLAHVSSFRAVSDAELRDLSEVLRGILGIYRHRLDDPEYNLVIHSAPRELEQEPYLHWQLQILPRLTTPAGFELGSGMRIDTSTPEDDAAILAKALMARDADMPV